MSRNLYNRTGVHIGIETYYVIQIELEFNNSAKCRSINGKLQWQVDVGKNCTGRLLHYQIVEVKCI